MSIFATATIQLRPYQVKRDPGDPDFIWYTRRAVTGDASGGVRGIDINFRASTAPPIGTLFSLEDIGVDDTDNVAKAVGVFTSGFDDFEGVAIPRFLEFDLRDSSAIGAATLSPDDPSPLRSLPLVLGVPRKSTDAVVTVRTTNVNAAVWRVYATGYAWNTLGLPGGPRRPRGDLFGKG